jgi:hypothetical protein
MNNQINKTSKEIKKDRNIFLRCIFWWEINEDELKEQIIQYNDLDILHSARKLSALFFIFSAILTIVFVLFFNINNIFLLDATLMFILAFFMYHRYRWAFIAAMIYWTYSKLISLLPNPNNPETIPISIILFWLVYMHYFYLAFKVEQKRKTQENNNL